MNTVEVVVIIIHCWIHMRLCCSGPVVMSMTAMCSHRTKQLYIVMHYVHILALTFDLHAFLSTVNIQSVGSMNCEKWAIHGVHM